MVGILRIKDQNGEWQDIQALRGATGPQGPVGPEGPQGPKGADGTVSFNDLTEEQKESLRGAEGPQGEQGIQGIQGEVGPQGPQGEQGIQGPIGETGATGPEGPQGPAGADYVLTEADKDEIADIVETKIGDTIKVDNTTIIRNEDGSISTAIGGYVEVGKAGEPITVLGIGMGGFDTAMAFDNVCLLNLSNANVYDISNVVGNNELYTITMNITDIGVITFENVPCELTNDGTDYDFKTFMATNYTSATTIPVRVRIRPAENNLILIYETAQSSVSINALAVENPNNEPTVIYHPIDSRFLDLSSFGYQTADNVAVIVNNKLAEIGVAEEGAY